MTIRKRGDKYVLLSRKGKVLGKYSSKSAALKREEQIRYFLFKKGNKK